MDIRVVESLDDIGVALNVFNDVWHAPEREQLPHNLLRALTSHTNLLLGAFDGTACVGAVLGWWGRDPSGEVFLFSQKLCVIEPYRGSGVAESLKQEQARIALQRGVDELRWTFDPMRALNASFNLRKLGAIGTGFTEDMYGPRSDALNAGERTDRMMVSWRAPASPGTDMRRVRIETRDRLRDDLMRAFDDGFRATGFERPDTYVMTR